LYYLDIFLPVNLRKTKQSALLAREKYEADKVLEVGNKIKELKRTHEWFLVLASHSPAMHLYPTNGSVMRPCLMLLYQILTTISKLKMIICS
jgi:hypothetical protein